MTAFGGTGGTINITASNATAASPEGSPPPAQIDLDNTTVVASDDGTVTSNTPDSHSQVGGTINLKSMLPSGPGILVEDGSNLVALVNANSTGAGGTIKLLTSGATIEVDTSTLQASGTGSLVQLNNQTGTTGYSFNPGISLSGATISADTVKIQSNGGITFYTDYDSNQATSVTAASALTINSPQPIIGDGESITTLSVTNSSGLINPGGTINIDTVSPTFGGDIVVQDATLAADKITFNSRGPNGTIYINNSYYSDGPLPVFTATTSLSLSGAIIQLYTAPLDVTSATGTLTMDTVDPTQTGQISLDGGSSVTASSITLTSRGTASNVTITDNSLLTGTSLLSISGVNIMVNEDSTLTADNNVGQLTLDTVDTTQTGMITLDSATLSAASLNLAARGTGGTVNITDSSMLTGTNQLTVAGDTIQVTNSTLTTTGTGSVFTLGGAGGTGGGANIQMSGATLSAAGNLTLTGAPGSTGADIQVNGSTLSADGVGNVLTLTTASTTGAGILVNGNSTLSATNVNDGAGGTINLLTSGASIEVDNSSLTASGTGSLLQLNTQQPTSDGSATSINLDGATLSADTITLSTAGPNDQINIIGGSTLTAVSTLTITGVNISLGSVFSDGGPTNTLTADPAAGSITLDTVDTTQTGMITLDLATLSAAGIQLTARGTGGTVDIAENSTLTGTNQLSVEGATIEVTNSTLTTFGPSSVLTLGGAGGTGSGANIQLSDSTLSAAGNLTLTGAPGGTGADIQVSGSTLSASGGGNVLTLTTASTTGAGILINNSSTLSSTNTSSNYGGTINLLTSGASIEVDDSTLTASGTGSLLQLNTQVAPPGASGSTSINLTGATLSADTVNLLTAGPNDMVNLNGGNTLTAISTLTITANSINTGGFDTTDQLSASMTSGTINLNATNGTTGNIFLSGGSLSANTINLQAVGDDAQISIGNTPTITAGSNLTINGANIDLYGNGASSDNGQISASNSGGTISLTASATTTPATIQISDIPLTADKFIFTASGPGSFISLDDEPSGNLVAQSSVLLSAPTITITSSTLSADPTVGTLTIDTTDTTQNGQIIINDSNLSAATIDLTARGAAGTVSINSSTLSSGGTVSVTAQGANGTIMVGGTGGTGGVQAALTASSGDLTLQTPGANGSITINPYSTLAANSNTLNLLAPGTTGSITVGSASNTDATMLSGELLKMRAMGTSGAITIYADSTLSATSQLLLYADGSNGAITFAGSGTITLKTGTVSNILAAPTITINSGTTVNVTGNGTGNTTLTVYTTTGNYNTSGYSGNTGSATYGSFTGSEQPTGTPLPLSDAPTFTTTRRTVPLGSNAAVPTTASPTLAANATKSGQGKLAATATRPAVLPLPRPSIPFSALNLKDLSYDPSLLQSGPKTVAAAAKPDKAGTRAPARDASAGREKVRDAAARPESASNKPAPALLASPLRPPH